MKSESIQSCVRRCKAKTFGGFMAMVFLVGFSSLSSAGVQYDEAIDGDLPHPNNPSVIAFGLPNPNTIKFTVDIFSDAWIVDIPSGVVLESFTLTSFAPVGAGATATFILHDGPSITDPALGTAYYSSFDVGLLNVDFLDHFDIGPLGPGQYLFNFWHDNTPNPTMEFVFDFDVAPPFMANPCQVHEIGGTINFYLFADAANANRTYLILGNITGTAPGIPLAGGSIILPINWDLFTDLIVANLNTVVFTDFAGQLDSSGAATAHLNLPTLTPAVLGLTMNFAYVLWGPIDYASNAVSLVIVP